MGGRRDIVAAIYRRGCVSSGERGRPAQPRDFRDTSHFTPEAKEILERMSDKFVGYDGDDVFEAAKECSFGLKQKDGVWTLDEELLSGGKAFFNLL